MIACLRKWIKSSSRAGGFVRGRVEKGSVDPWPGGGGQREAVNCLFGNGWHIVAGASNSPISCCAWASLSRLMRGFSSACRRCKSSSPRLFAARLMAIFHERVCDQEHAGALLQEQNEAIHIKPVFSGLLGVPGNSTFAIGGNEQMRWHTGDCLVRTLQVGRYHHPHLLPALCCMLHPSHPILANASRSCLNSGHGCSGRSTAVLPRFSPLPSHHHHPTQHRPNQVNRALNIDMSSVVVSYCCLFAYLSIGGSH